MPEEATKPEADGNLPIERVQLGIRMEKNLVKVLKGLAEFKDMTLGEFFESIILHAFTPAPGEEGRWSASPLAREDLAVLDQLKEIYGVQKIAHAYQRFEE